jgi:hypothetical protein
MKKRRLIVAVVVLMCLGAIVAAQDNPPVPGTADKVVREQSGRTTLTGNVVLTVNGVVARADRAVMQGSEVTLEGNVRLTLPKPVYTAAAMRNRIQAPPPPPPVVVPYVVRPKQIDTPIPQPWQPPPSNQR